jgi:quinol-cytochrome oxidoreductase complex cytochrome b subunit
VLLLITLLLSYTGYLLPWDQLAFWAITVGSNLSNAVPLVGSKIHFLLLGGNQVNANALLRFYVLHCVVLPLAAILFIAIHFWRIRKDGGLYVQQSEPKPQATGASALTVKEEQ